MTRVVRLDAAQLRWLAGPAASVYGAAMHRSPEVVIQRRDIIAAHVSYPGLVAAGAFDDAGAATGSQPAEPTLVGFGYGYCGAVGQWWHDAVAAGLGRADTARWLHDGFELAELHVLPDYHGQGWGRTLLTDVLARAEAAHAVLSTPDVESPARSLYRSHGFRDLRCRFFFPGSNEAYAIMGVDL